jgi:glycosyltransferase involved in cell wall biosynthesis
MRLAFFHNLPSGGAKRCAHELIKLLSIKHEIDLFIYDKHAEDFLDMRQYVNKTILVDGGETNNGKGLRRLMSLKIVKSASKRTAEIINLGNYELALIMQCKVANSPFVLRYLRLPSLYFCHEPLAKILEPHYRSNEQDGLLGPIKKIFLRWAISIDRYNALKATQICTSSLYCIENIYRNYGVYASLNYLGVDTQNFAPQHYLERLPVVLVVGALNAAKGQDFVIESIGTMQIKPEIIFIYNFSYGTLEFKKQLIDRAKQLGVSVTFKNMVNEKELVSAYNQVSLTIFPSRLEPLGLVPLESMACGTPVVGIAEAGIRETIQDGQNGLLTERDPIEFGNAINKLLSDKLLWKSISEEGIKRVASSWTWEKSCNTLEKNINKTINKHKCLDF